MERKNKKTCLFSYRSRIRTVNTITSSTRQSVPAKTGGVRLIWPLREDVRRPRMFLRWVMERLRWMSSTCERLTTNRACMEKRMRWYRHVAHVAADVIAYRQLVFERFAALGWERLALWCELFALVPRILESSHMSSLLLWSCGSWVVYGTVEVSLGHMGLKTNVSISFDR